MAEPPKQGELSVDEELDDLEIRLERLRSLYEQYFLGLEKIEPQVARKDVDRRIWQLRRAKVRNTARRFKLQTIVMRYNTFQQYWQRICREIENGTYKRHLLRAEKTVGMAPPMTIAAKKRLGLYARGKPRDDEAVEHIPSPRQSPAAPPPLVAPPAQPGPPVAAKPERRLERLELDMDDMFGPKLAKPASPAVKPPPAKPAPPPLPARPPPAPAGGVSDERVRELHRRLVDAQRQLANARPVSVEGLAKSLRDAETKLKAQHGNRRIDFDIVVKDGRAVVKPILR